MLLTGALIGISIAFILTFLTLDLQFVIFLCIFLIMLSFLFIELLTINKLEGGVLQILEINQDRNMRCLRVTMVNNNLLEGEDLFKGIYKTLQNNKDYLNCGFQKIIILSVVLATDKEYNLHSNILINNNTTFKEYYSTISHELNRYNNLQYGYHNELISRYVMLTWNVDNKQNMLIKQTHKPSLNGRRSYSTVANKWYKGLITPPRLI
jgi:hypothetical protein